MNIEAVSADIARRVPDMVQDSRINNAELIEGIIRPLLHEGMLCATAAICEEVSEIVSDKVDQLGVPRMRCSPDLPAYVKGLEVENAKLRELLQHVAYHNTTVFGQTVFELLDDEHQMQIHKALEEK